MSVPTPTEDELLDTLEEVQRSGAACCRLCDEVVVEDAQDWGEVLDALVEHGEARDDHVWDEREGWSFVKDAEPGGVGE